MKFLFAFTILLFTFFPAQGQEQQVPTFQPKLYCLTFEQATAKLEETKMVGMFGGVSQLGVVLVYINPLTQEWVTLVIPPEGNRVCVVSAGKGYKFKSPGQDT